MKPLGRFSILLLALTGAGAAAAAEPASEQRIAYKFGACVVKQDRQAAIRFLDELPLVGGAVSASDLDAGEANSCVSSDLDGVSPVAIRGGIAQELFLRDFQEFGLEPKRKGGFAYLALPIAEGSEEADPKAEILYKLGDCVVRNRSDTVERMLKAPLGSRVEQQLIASLTPIMGACHGSNGQARLSRDDFRSILAQSAYSASARYWNGRLQAVLR
jgi:hypothetical protein